MKQVTLREIAEATGVSTMTVSRSLRGVGRVNERTRRRVREAAKRMGYGGVNECVLGPPAHRGTTDHQLRLLLPFVSPYDSEIVSAISEELLRGLRDRLALNGGTLSIHECRDLDDVLDALAESHANGLVLRRQVPVSWIERLRQEGPLVLATSHDFYYGVDVVYANEMRAAGSIVSYLAEAGHQQLCWFGLYDRNSPGQLPASLFDDTVLDQDTRSIHAPRYASWFYLAHRFAPDRAAAVVMVDRDWNVEDLEAACARGIGQILRQRPRPTAIIVPSVAMAQTIIPLLSQHGLNVPNDMSVVCYGVPAESTPGEPRLTMIALPMYDIGRAVPDLIERHLATPEAPPVTLQFEARLVEGNTVAPISREKQ